MKPDTDPSPRSEIKQRFRIRELATPPPPSFTATSLLSGFICRCNRSFTVYISRRDRSTRLSFRRINRISFPSSSCFCFHMSLSLSLSFLPVWFFGLFRFGSSNETGIGCVNFYGLTFHRRRIKNVSSPVVARLERRAAAEISCPSLKLSASLSVE